MPFVYFATLIQISLPPRLVHPVCRSAVTLGVRRLLSAKREEGVSGDDALMAEMRSTYMPGKGEVRPNGSMPCPEARDLARERMTRARCVCLVWI